MGARKDSPSAEKKWVQIAMILIVAFLIRAGFVYFQVSTQYFSLGFVSPDGRLYDALAMNLLSGEGYAYQGEPTAFVTPMYPIFLAFLYRMIGTSVVGVGLVQSAVGAASCGLVIALTERLFSPRAGRLAGWGSAVYPHLIFWTGYVLTETLFVFWVLLSLWSAVVALQKKQLFWVGLAAFSMAAGGLTRPVLFGFAPLTLLLFLISRPPPRPAGTLAVFCLVFFGLIFPWALRNHLVLGRWVWGSSESGYVFYMGNSTGATGGTRGYVDHQDFGPPPIPEGLNEVEKNTALWRLGLQFIRENPMEWARLSGRKFINMWRPAYTGASLRNRIVLGGSYLILVFLAAGGMIFAFGRTQRPGLWVLYLFLLYFTGIHMAVIGMIRFRVAAEPVLILFAGYFVSLFLKEPERLP